MVDEEDQEADTDHGQDDRYRDREGGDELRTPLISRPDCALYQESVGEGANEDSEHHLAGEIGGEVPEYARGELARSKLERHDRDREDHAGHRNDPAGDRAQDPACTLGTAAEIGRAS